MFDNKILCFIEGNASKRLEEKNISKGPEEKGLSLNLNCNVF